MMASAKSLILQELSFHYKMAPDTPCPETVSKLGVL